MPLGDYLKTFEIRPSAGAVYEPIRVSGFNASAVPISRTGSVEEELFDKRLVQMIDAWRLRIELSWDEMTDSQAQALSRLIPDMVGTSVALRFPDAGIPVSPRSFTLEDTGSYHKGPNFASVLAGDTYTVSGHAEVRDGRVRGIIDDTQTAVVFATKTGRFEKVITPTSDYDIFFYSSGDDFTISDLKVTPEFGSTQARAVTGLILSDVQEALRCVFEARVRNKAAGFTLVDPQPLTTAEVAALDWLLT